MTRSNPSAPCSNRNGAGLVALLLGVLGILLARPAQAQWFVPTPTLPPGSVDGQLDDTDRLDEEGRYTDAYITFLEAGHPVRIWAMSETLDGVLAVEGPEGVGYENDDFWPDSLDPAVEFVPPVSGRYLIRYRSYTGGATGDYRVGLALLEPELLGFRVPLGSRGTYVLSEGGAGPGVDLGASFWLEVEAGMRLRLRITSSDFDTVAMLIAPNGQQWLNDDANDTGESGTESLLDSTVEAVAPEAGLYHLMVMPYDQPGAGRFEVRAQARAPVVLAEGEVRPQVGYAGTATQGRILGLFVGITEYLDGPLYGCADDARLLSRAFRERGLQGADDQIVLTDQLATRARFIDAMRELRTRATADDLVVIFFSGHGSQQDGRAGDPVELDGLDETLVLYDAEIIDDDVVAMIDLIDADTVLLAIDACSSGGFDRDFMTRPNRVGFFSSDEDVLSGTAEDLLAGGFLSYFLRYGVLGEADARPRDGALQVGELSDYLVEGFARAQDKMNPPGSNEPYQRLVIDRGAVGWGSLLWVYPREPDGELPDVPDLCLDSEPPEEGPASATGCR